MVAEQLFLALLDRVGRGIARPSGRDGLVLGLGRRSWLADARGRGIGIGIGESDAEGHGRLRGIWQRLLGRRGSRCGHKRVAGKGEAAVHAAMVKCIRLADEALVRGGARAARVADHEGLDIGPASIVDTCVLADIDGEEPCGRGIEVIRKEVDARLTADEGGGLLRVVDGLVAFGAVGARGFVKLVGVWIEMVGDETVMHLVARKDALDVAKTLGRREVRREGSCVSSGLHVCGAVTSEVSGDAAGARRHALDPVGDFAVFVTGDLDLGR